MSGGRLRRAANLHASGRGQAQLPAGAKPRDSTPASAAAPRLRFELVAYVLLYSCKRHCDKAAEDGARWGGGREGEGL